MEAMNYSVVSAAEVFIFYCEIFTFSLSANLTQKLMLA